MVCEVFISQTLLKVNVLLIENEKYKVVDGVHCIFPYTNIALVFIFFLLITFCLHSFYKFCILISHYRLYSKCFPPEESLLI